MTYRKVLLFFAFQQFKIEVAETEKVIVRLTLDSAAADGKNITFEHGELIDSNGHVPESFVFDDPLYKLFPGVFSFAVAVAVYRQEHL